MADITTRIHVFNADARESNGSVSHYLKKCCPETNLTERLPLFKCRIEIIPGVFIPGYAWGNHIFIDGSGYGVHYHERAVWEFWGLVSDTIALGDKSLDDEGSENHEDVQDAQEAFFSIRVISERAYTKIVKRKERLGNNYGGYGYGQEVQAVDAYVLNYYEAQSANMMAEIPYAYLMLEISAPNAQPITTEFRFRQPDFGIAAVSGSEVTVTSDFFGVTRTWKEDLVYTAWTYKEPPYDGRGFAYSPQEHKLINNPLRTLCHHLGKSHCPDNIDAWWEPFLGWHLPQLSRFNGGKLDDACLASVMKRKDIKPVLERLQKDSPLDWKFFTWLWESKTRDKQKNNSLLSAMLIQIGSDYNKLVKALQKARAEVPKLSPEGEGTSYRTDYVYLYDATRRQVCLNLPGAKEKVEEREAQIDFSKQKTNAGKAEVLGIDKSRFPKLFSCVESGDIPASVFANPDKQPVNREFPIWEKALARKGWAAEICGLATDAGRRSTYEKDITPYLAYLFRIEKYLDKHAPGGKGVKKWQAMPKYVESQWELEMDETEEGTTKKRSAFTPVADNETRVVTVPFVAVCVSGVRTQWCYSRHYYVFEEGMIDPESGGVIVSDLEEKLNGRDDYGLMYFTLTGTVTARGYPTFLIIFERLASKTRVHFHRVHPCRSKDGIKTLACNLVERCYQYMAGDVPAADITAQQGDLIYIKHGNDPVAAGAKVEEPQVSQTALVFENHSMQPRYNVKAEGEMKLYVSTAKTPKNRLGFLYVPGPWCVKHPEHDDIEEMASGWWEVRRCKSWEANPRAIWSLTID